MEEGTRCNRIARCSRYLYIPAYTAGEIDEISARSRSRARETRRVPRGFGPRRAKIVIRYSVASKNKVAGARAETRNKSASIRLNGNKNEEKDTRHGRNYSYDWIAPVRAPRAQRERHTIASPHSNLGKPTYYARESDAR